MASDNQALPAPRPAADTPGLILLAHGARDPAWAAPFERVAAQVRAQRPGWRVSLAYLEFMTPDLLTAGTLLAAQGCTRVTVLPLFLGVGGHVRRDVPALLAQLHTDHPGVRWQLAPAIGDDPRLLQALVSIALGAVPPQPG
ncbi:sirohydrochlorin chelatase [Tepidimonas aquatica]|uniref:Sirohydrochlorin ferrochelatase n=1 Tax=Tepidimonas aquatica TaxID=247482 RepID=A0A554WTR3_9BURK|nr:CbiX/SirB N-terminal domain-containing protein [Tepidimonas aquatica]TSE26943.1 Sirohydrochlorin ferrochelatase [Tepidimonas aquatica]